MKKMLIVPSLFFLASCGTKTSNANAFPSNNHHWLDPNPALSHEINLNIQSQLNQIPSACPIDETSTDPNCTLIDIHPGNAETKSESEGYRVLIIDDSSMRISAYTRYRKRVLKNLIEIENGGYTPDNTVLKIPLAAKNILIDTLNAEKYEKIPAQLLTPSESLFNEKLFSSLGQHMVGHGNSFFNYIANHSPKSQFVLAYTKGVNLNHILDDRGKSEAEKLTEIDNLFKIRSSDLGYYIKKYKINFISLSSGINEGYFKGNLFKLSQYAKNYINKSYYNNYLQNLTKNLDTILVQANGTTLRNFEMDDPGFFSDCAKNSQRLRVGFVRSFNYSIGTLGSRSENYIDREFKNYIKCTDMFINFPSTAKRPYLYNIRAPFISEFGIGGGAFVGREISSSTAAPVALSYLLYLKSMNPPASNSQLLEQVNILKGQKFVILDPAYHRQLPIYKLGYLQ